VLRETVDVGCCIGCCGCDIELCDAEGPPVLGIGGPPTVDIGGLAALNTGGPPTVDIGGPPILDIEGPPVSDIEGLGVLGIGELLAVDIGGLPVPDIGKPPVLATSWFCEFGGGGDPSCIVVGVGCWKTPGCTLLKVVGREGWRDGIIEVEVASCLMGVVALRWICDVEFAKLAFWTTFRLNVPWLLA